MCQPLPLVAARFRNTVTAPRPKGAVGGLRQTVRGIFSGAVQSRRGGALLVVLWLSAALSAIAFSLASSVRSETARVTTSVDRLKAQYLATGAIERALFYIEWGSAYPNPDGTPRYYPGMPRFEFQFPTGQASVEVIPESSKMSVNLSPPEDLYRLLSVLSGDPERAREIVAGIVDWRTRQPVGTPGLFDEYYLSRNPSFLPPHASFEEIEELLLIKGMTPELFYGTYDRNAGGRLTPRHGAVDCLSVYGGISQFDVNSVAPELLAAIGVPPEAAGAIVERRKIRPFRDGKDMAALDPEMPGRNRLGLGAGSMFTLRATGRPRSQDGTLSDARRSVAALVKFLDPLKSSDRYHVLRWYGSVWAE
jgi:general secretion pathway protein K